MANLYGKNYTKKDLLRLVGDLSQIGGIRPVEYMDGNERGVRALQFKTGSGLEFTILPDRAMDVYEAKFNGKSLCWHSQAGPVNPAFKQKRPGLNRGVKLTILSLALLMYCNVTQSNINVN